MDIKNLTRCAVDKKMFSTVAKKVLKGENKGIETISLVLVGPEEIKQLNRKFRKKNKPTDVLSFELKEKELLGEIVICPQVVKEKGEKMIEVFVHGILHLCGYDHEKSEAEAKKMEEKEKHYLKIIKI